MLMMIFDAKRRQCRMFIVMWLSGMMGTLCPQVVCNPLKVKCHPLPDASTPPTFPHFNLESLFITK
jgi:hypothetical protein